ncbi:MAG: pitrilysin family protein [Bacteroidales bacterium]|nr:pitrilysin family protein [Bacteroidales bacterium]
MIKFDRFILKNGLTLLVYQDKSTPLVSVNTLYKVGAVNEDDNRTGFAHLFEHLMFGGSVNVPDFDTVLQRAGGENNAFTNNDITNYYITVPLQNIETAFYLESDRMLELAFSSKSLDVQKNVVSEEFRQRYLNQPYGDVSLYLRPLAYTQHPYKWATIGKEISHITEANLQEVKDFFYNHYAPNNAILVVAGNVKPDNILKLAEKWFGNIPNRNLKKNLIPIEPLQTQKRELTLERDVTADAIYMAYHMSDRLSDDYYASDLISDLLSNGKSSMFNINLVKGDKLFSQLDAYIQGSTFPGLFMINGRLYPETDFERAEIKIKEQLDKIIRGEFSNRDLQKVKNRAISAMLFARVHHLNIAMELAYLEALGDAEMINGIESKYQQVTHEKIMEVASKIFRDENLSCVYYKSKNKKND